MLFLALGLSSLAPEPGPCLEDRTRFVSQEVAYQQLREADWFLWWLKEQRPLHPEQTEAIDYWILQTRELRQLWDALYEAQTDNDEYGYPQFRLEELYRHLPRAYYRVGYIPPVLPGWAREHYEAARTPRQ